MIFSCWSWNFDYESLPTTILSLSQKRSGYASMKMISWISQVLYPEEWTRYSDQW